MTENTKAREIREIRADLNAITPWHETGDVTAAGLARHFAGAALERWSRSLNDESGIGSELYMARLAAMCADFAAAVALAALADPLSPPLWGPEGFGANSPGELAQAAATMIRDVLEDGDSAGEWLHEFLGKDTAQEITRLAAELDAARAKTPEVPQ